MTDVNHPCGYTGSYSAFYGWRGFCRSKGIGWRLDSFIVSHAYYAYRSIFIVDDRCFRRGPTYRPRGRVDPFHHVASPFSKADRLADRFLFFAFATTKAFRTHRGQGSRMRDSPRVLRSQRSRTYSKSLKSFRSSFGDHLEPPKADNPASPYIPLDILLTVLRYPRTTIELYLKRTSIDSIIHNLKPTRTQAFIHTTI